ncbi:MAG: hypothetical protein R2791_12920 [Saprospiraceae bacterium]
MPFAKTTFIFLFLILGIQSASAQNLTIGYQHPDSLFVCGTDTFSVTVFNNSALPATDIKFTLTLPEGIIYIAGSVDGATEFNVDDLHMPVFAISSIPGNASSTIKIMIHADCMAADLTGCWAVVYCRVAGEFSRWNRCGHHFAVHGGNRPAVDRQCRSLLF